MASLKQNIVANFGGQSVSVLVGLLAMPIYLRILGIESYGLIGFYLSLQAMFAILDLGLSSTLSRELARYTHSGGDPNIQRDLVRTLEWLYWPIGALIALLVFAVSGSIALHWLKSVTLTPAETAAAISLMGLATALQWPFALYQGGLRGVERQVSLNLLSAGAAITRAVACILVLVYVAPTLPAFLACQIAIAALQTMLSRSLLWRILPPGNRPPRFSRELLVSVRRFSFGLTGISILTLLLMQSDKIILSSMLPLDEFGYYTVAATVAGALSSTVGPFFFSLYPRYSGLVATGATASLIDLYHQSNQWLTVCVTSVATVVALFAHDLLLLWTQDPVVASKSAPILSILIIGTALQGLAHLPYALQLAHGWTRLAFYQNLIAIFIIVPAIWWLAHWYGGLGAAFALLALNLVGIIVTVPVMHNRLLRGELSRWYGHDILPPTLAALFVALSARILVPAIPGGLAGVALLAAIGGATLAASCLASSSIRAFLMCRLRLLVS